jgi:quinol monooxygenase YgiN
VTTPTDDAGEPLTLVASLRAAAGQTETLRSALETLVKHSAKEDGCLGYDLHQGVDDPSFFTIFESWASQKHLDAHLSTPHLSDFGAKVGDLVAGDGPLVNRVRRIA